jgi:bile acid:Na+ symporter, BASS family
VENKVAGFLVTSYEFLSRVIKLTTWTIIKKGLQFNQAMEKRMILVVASGLFLGALFHNPVAHFKPATSYMFAYLTFVMALGCSINDFRNAVKSPGLMLTILGLLHIVLPVLAFILIKLFLPTGAAIQAGIILGTAVPIGVSSVIWVAISGGNVALALTTVVVDTILSPLIVPGILLIIMGRTIHFDIQQLMLGLMLMVVVPTFAGIIVHDLSRGQVGRKWRFINGPVTKILLAAVVAINLAVAWNSLHLLKASLVIIVALVLVLGCSGYLLGYFVAKLAKLSPTHINTFIFSVGMRNITAGLVMALQYFTELTAIPVVFSILLQQPLAALCHRFLVIKKKDSVLSDVEQSNPNGMT